MLVMVEEWGDIPRRVEASKDGGFLFEVVPAALSSDATTDRLSLYVVRKLKEKGLTCEFVFPPGGSVFLRFDSPPEGIKTQDWIAGLLDLEITVLA